MAFCDTPWLPLAESDVARRSSASGLRCHHGDVADEVAVAGAGRTERRRSLTVVVILGIAAALTAGCGSSAATASTPRGSPSGRCDVTGRTPR